MSDREKENKKKTRKLLMKYLIKHVIILSYNPQANGMIERGHQPIVDALSKTVEVYVLGREKKYRRLIEAGGKLDSKVLRGFYLRTEWLWQRPLPKLARVMKELHI